MSTSQENQFPSFDDEYSKKAQAKQYVQEVAEKLQVHFFNHNYYLLNGDGVYEEHGPAEIRRVLRVGHRIPKKLLDEALYLIDHRRVDWAGPLAGYQPGVAQYGTDKLLITKGPQMVEPVKGKCPETQTIIQKLCGDQWARVCAWLKVARAQIVSGSRRPGQVLVLAGPIGCGKSFTQERIITPLLGGRAADPFQYMIGQTPFNSHIFGAEHLIIDDKIPHGDPHARKVLANAMKQAASVTSGSCHPKGLKPVQLPRFCRLSITCNDDERSLSVLPPLDEDLEGKLILLATQSFEFSWPQNENESVEFNEMIADQIPATAYWIDHLPIAQGIQDRRYGVSGYVDPELRKKISRLGDEFLLLELARQAVEHATPKKIFPCEHTAYDWFELIRGNWRLQEGLLRITQSPDGLGRMLSRLWTNKVKGVKRRVKDGRPLYLIEADEKEEDTPNDVVS